MLLVSRLSFGQFFVPMEDYCAAKRKLLLCFPPLSCVSTDTKDSLAEPLQIPTQLRHFSTTTTVGDWKFLLLAAIVSTRIPQLT
jgi:hypothetical protein